ncbi:MAG: dockerin type I domain-containing protein, partial [Oscillospiraceae bacterium]|nr:dockerin type I domain-containing protein [Oscillospiraceae bacterium]
MALFKKVSAATLALLMSASAVTASAASEKILLSSSYGDADNNGVVNTRDFVAMADAILNNGGNVSKDGKIYNYDFNFDGKKTVEDMAVLKKMLITGKLVNSFDAYTAQKAMVKAYINETKSFVKSEINTVVNDNGTEYTSNTKSEITRTGEIGHITSDAVQDNGDVTQNIYIEPGKVSGLDVHKNINKEGWKTENKDKSSAALQEVIADVITTAQIPQSAGIPSLNILEKLLYNPNALSEENFKNAYTYSDSDFNYIAVPVEDVTETADATDVAGTYIIKINAKTNLPVRIEIVIGTATVEDTYLVENGFAEFFYTDTTTINDIVIPNEVYNGNVQPTVEPSTNPSVEPSSNPSVEPS